MRTRLPLIKKNDLIKIDALNHSESFSHYLVKVTNVKEGAANVLDFTYVTLEPAELRGMVLSYRGSYKHLNVIGNIDNNDLLAALYE